MSISSELKKEISQGDYTQIARLLFEKTGKKISARYVSMILNDERTTTKSDLATEVVTIAKRFLQNRKVTRDQIIAQS